MTMHKERKAKHKENKPERACISYKKIKPFALQRIMVIYGSLTVLSKMDVFFDNATSIYPHESIANKVEEQKEIKQFTPREMSVLESSKNIILEVYEYLYYLLMIKCSRRIT